MIEYVDLISRDDMGSGGELGGPLSAGDGKVPDGLRYHVLDVWVEELVKVEGWDGVKEMMMRPVKGLAEKGRTKVVRARAKEVLGDRRLLAEDKEEEMDGGEGGREESAEEFEGFGE